MNWDDLRLFLAIAREGSVSGAGKQLGMHHTNVARRMSRFEEVLGARLFVRSKAGYTMTAAGERLYTRWSFRQLLEQQAVDYIQQAINSCPRAAFHSNLGLAYDALGELDS